MSKKRTLKGADFVELSYKGEPVIIENKPTPTDCECTCHWGIGSCATEHDGKCPDCQETPTDFREYKQCTTCKQAKPSEAFYRFRRNKDGRTPNCIECRKGINWLYRIRNASREVQRNKEYYSSERAKPIMIAKTLRQIEKSPEKHKARYTLRNAVKRGEVVKKPCAVCDEPKVQAHHPNYQKPLDVIWLCIKHHKQIHQAIQV